MSWRRDAELVWTFCRMGLFTIGGGYAMIPLIQRTVVERKRWLSEQELLDLMAVAQSCPGIFAINISIFVGLRRAGVRGAALCALGTALPSFVCILLIAMVFQQFSDNPWVASAFRGIRPAVVALIAAPALRMAKTARLGWRTVWVAVAAALAIWLGGVNPVVVIALAGIGGWAWGMLQKEKEEDR